MKAFITGVGGFVGQHMARYLVSKGLDVHGSYNIHKPKVNNVTLHKVDIVERKKLLRIVAKTAPDYIFHFAAVSSVKKSLEDPAYTKKVNVIGTKNLLDAVSSLQLSSRTLLVSSAEVYGEPKTIPITEEHPVNPKNPYAESKLEMEQLAQTSDTDYIITRSFTHIGPGQPPVYFCSEFAKTIAEIEKGLRAAVLTFGDPEIVRDITDVRDIVKAYLLCMEKAKKREIYNICSGKGISIKEVLDTLTAYSRKKIVLKQDKSKVVKKSIRTMIGSAEKFCKLTQWKPKIGIEKSLYDLLSYWRKNT